MGNKRLSAGLDVPDGGTNDCALYVLPVLFQDFFGVLHVLVSCRTPGWKFECFHGN